MADGKIIVLVENTAGGRGLLGEHGLSFWIELGGQRVLFDTGQGHALLNNAQRLGIRLDQVDAIALSHGHYDHAGGLSEVLRIAPRATLHVHRAAFESKYACDPNGRSRDVGMSVRDRQAIGRNAQIAWVEGPTAIGAGLNLTGPVPRTTDFEDTGGAFFKDPDCIRADDLVDDQAAFVETAVGTVVILGCAHAGVVNTLRHVRSLTDGKPIHTVIGGMHLLNAGPKRMDKTVVELRRLDVQHLLPCHCTGFAPTLQLWNWFPGRCSLCRVGTAIEMPG